MASPNFWNIAHGEGERMRERRTVNLADPPLQKEKAPAGEHGAQTGTTENLTHRSLIVNSGHASNRELLIATAECLEVLREFAGSGGGAR